VATGIGCYCLLSGVILRKLSKSRGGYLLVPPECAELFYALRLLQCPPPPWPNITKSKVVK